MAFLADNQAIVCLWKEIIWLAFGVCVIFLSLALYERLKAGSPLLAQAATVFGLIYAVLVIVIGTLSINDLNTVVRLHGENPAQAATVWLTLDAVETGLNAGGGETIVIGLWPLASGLWPLASAAGLGSAAGKGASQTAELPWGGDRPGRHPLCLHGLRCAVGRQRSGSHLLVRLARGRDAAQEPCRGSVKKHDLATRGVGTRSPTCHPYARSW